MEHDDDLLASWPGRWIVSDRLLFLITTLVLFGALVADAARDAGVHPGCQVAAVRTLASGSSRGADVP